MESQQKTYELKALLYLKNKINEDILWSHIANKISIPDDFSPFVKNALIKNGYIEITHQVDEGDFIKTTPKGVEAISKLIQQESPPTAKMFENKWKFTGELEERDILIHALNFMKASSEHYSWIAKMFPGITDIKEREFIKSVLKTSPLFEHKNTGFQYSFNLTDAAKKLLFKGDAVNIVDNSLKSTENHISPFIQFTDNSTKTFGDNSPVSGRDMKVRDIKKDVNTESPEQKDIARKGLTLNKWMLIFAIVAIAVSIAIYLLQRANQQ